MKDMIFWILYVGIFLSSFVDFEEVILFNLWLICIYLIYLY